MTSDRIVEYQRHALVRQEQHLQAALERLRRQDNELELRREHNAILMALLAQRDRRLAAVRAELQQLRDLLADAPSITEPGGFAG